MKVSKLAYLKTSHGGRSHQPQKSNEINAQVSEREYLQHMSYVECNSHSYCHSCVSLVDYGCQHAHTAAIGREGVQDMSTITVLYVMTNFGSSDGEIVIVCAI